MFVSLLIVTFLVAFGVSFIVERVFNRQIGAILTRIVSEELSTAWHRYIRFAIYVVGISGGVRIWALEKYITPSAEESQALVLNTERWILEVYRTIIATLQSVAWTLLVFFLFALLAYVVVRAVEMKHMKEKTEG